MGRYLIGLADSEALYSLESAVHPDLISTIPDWRIGPSHESIKLPFRVNRCVQRLRLLGRTPPPLLKRAVVAKTGDFAIYLFRPV